MDATLMSWTQVLAIVLPVLASVWWTGSESNADIKNLRAEANAERIALTAILTEMNSEMKDFHGRLCAIEEKQRRTNE